MPARPDAFQVRMARFEVGVRVLDDVRVRGRPERRRRGDGDQGQRAQHRQRDRHARLRAEPAGKWIGQEPGDVRERELGGEHGRAVAGRRGAPEQPSGRGLRGGVADPERQPGGQQHRPADDAAPGRGGKAEQHDAEERRRREHDRAVGQPVEHPRQQQSRQHRAAAEQPERHRDVVLGPLQEGLHDHHRVDDDHGAGRRHREVQGEKPAQPRRGEVDPQPPRGALVHPRLALGRRRGRERHRDDQGGRTQESDDRAAEQPVEVDDRQQQGGQCRTEQVLQVVGEARERQRPGVVTLVREDVRDGRLEGRREGRRAGLQHEHQ